MTEGMNKNIAMLQPAKFPYYCTIVQNLALY